MPKTSDSKRKYLVPKDLAKMAKCSERTIREYCKRGKIQEARRPSGGHWRIRQPLSGKTKLFLQKMRGDWPFDGSKDAEGEFEPDVAGWFMEAQLYEKNVDQCFPAPELADLEPKKRKAAARIQREIYRMVANGESLSSMLLIGWVYQLSLKDEGCPTVGEVADMMGLSRSAFYRKGHTLREIQRAHYRVCVATGIDLPGPVGATAGSDSDPEPED
jgi:Helix-turn-helix domain